MTGSQKKSRCFFDVEIAGETGGRIVFDLFFDICPKTAENFRTLCTGELGTSEATGATLHFRGSPFHRVIKNFMIQGGDITAGDGTGGQSIYGDRFEDENFELKHTTPYLLSMANKGKNTNGSQFFITTKPAPHLDGIHVVFGRVVSGEDIVRTIENLPVAENSKPLQFVAIKNCGELIRKAKTKRQRSPGSEASSSAKKRKKKKKKKEKKHKKAKKSSKDKKDKEPDIKTNGDATNIPDEEETLVCSIRPDEVPDVPENKFLLRDVEKRNEVPKHIPGSNYGGYHIDHNGRKVKGRGTFRYNRLYRSRSRSPPQWRPAPDRKRNSTQNYSRGRRRSEVVTGARRGSLSPSRRKRSRSTSRSKNRARSSPGRRKSRSSPSRKRSVSPQDKKKRSKASPRTRKRSRSISQNRKKSRSASQSRKRSRSTSQNRKKSRSASQSRKRSRSTSLNRKKSRSASQNRKRSRSTSPNRDKRTRSSSQTRKRSRSSSQITGRKRSRSSSQGGQRSRSSSQAGQRSRSSSQNKSSHRDKFSETST